MEVQLHATIEKLRFMLTIQREQKFWYADSVLLTGEDVAMANRELGRALGPRLVDLAMELGDGLEEGDEEDVTVKLYRFNETLTRLLSGEQGFEETELDYNLLITALLRLLLDRLAALSSSSIITTTTSSATTTATKKHLLDNILNKNISQRLLRPFHAALQHRCQLHLHQSS